MRALQVDELYMPVQQVAVVLCGAVFVVVAAAGVGLLEVLLE